MPKMTATIGFEYAGRRLRRGEVFDASSRDARVLALVGRASYAEAAPGVTAQSTTRRGRGYQRRDVQAEA